MGELKNVILFKSLKSFKRLRSFCTFLVSTRYKMLWNEYLKVALNSFETWAVLNMFPCKKIQFLLLAASL